MCVCVCVVYMVYEDISPYVPVIQKLLNVVVFFPPVRAKFRCRVGVGQ